MTTLLDRAMTELKKRSDREQDDVARDILARIGEPIGRARVQSTVFGRGIGEITRANPDDDFIDLLSEDDVAAWYANPDPVNP
jgi:hypothetical protein